MLVWFLLFPLLGLGVAGLEGGWIFPILSMVRHWAYAVPLAYYFPVVHENTAATLVRAGATDSKQQAA